MHLKAFFVITFIIASFRGLPYVWTAIMRFQRVIFPGPPPPSPAEAARAAADRRQRICDYHLPRQDAAHACHVLASFSAEARRRDSQREIARAAAASLASQARAAAQRENARAAAAALASQTRAHRRLLRFAIGVVVSVIVAAPVWRKRR